MPSRTITLEISDDAFTALEKRAAREGTEPEELAREAVEASVTDGQPRPPNRALIDALDRLVAFGESSPPAPPDPMTGGVPRVVRWVHEGRGEAVSDSEREQ